MSGSTLDLYWGIESNAEAELQARLLASSLGIVAHDKDTLLRKLYEEPAAELVTRAAWNFVSEHFQHFLSSDATRRLGSLAARYSSV